MMIGAQFPPAFLPRAERGDVSSLPPAKFLLRTLLRSPADRFGLGDRLIDAMVIRSQVTFWRAGRLIPALGEDGDSVQVLVSGAVRVVCPGAGDVPITVRIVPPGWLLNPTPLTGDTARLIAAEAYAPSLVASINRRVLEGMLAEMPSDRLFRLLTDGWRLLVDLVIEKCQLLTMLLPDRLMRELAILAGDFGRPHPGGTLIDLPLAHADLAGLVVATRPNVCRAMIELRREGRVAYAGRQIVLMESRA